ncbi:MAG: hypothetical protein OJF51_004701 [Nitrospira sp.]|nr:MAG: hypothetical protein OJF51_004701 [Nitrospira sp.]
MRPRMRGIMRMLEADPGNYLFDDLQKIFVGSLPDFPSC